MKLIDVVSLSVLLVCLGCQYYGTLGERVFHASIPGTYQDNAGILQQCVTLLGVTDCKWFDKEGFKNAPDETKAYIVLSVIAAAVGLLTLVLQICKFFSQNTKLSIAVIMASTLNAAIVATVVGLIVKTYLGFPSGTYKLSWSFATLCVAIAANIVHFILQIISRCCASGVASFK